MTNEEWDLVDKVITNVVQNLDNNGSLRMPTEDAEQEAWIVALGIMDQDKEHENLEGYLYLRLRGAILNKDKLEWREGITGLGKNRIEIEGLAYDYDEDDLEYEEPEGTKQDMIEVEEKTPLHYAIEAETMELARAVMNKDEAEVIRLIYFEDLYTELPSILGMPRTTIQRIHVSALEKLREAYSDCL